MSDQRKASAPEERGVKTSALLRSAQHPGGASSGLIGAEPQGSELTPNTQEAIDFLVRYRGDNSVVLTAIGPEGGAESETFQPRRDVERLRAWIDKRQGKFNIYFTVNPCRVSLVGRVKAKKEHIRGMVALHVDLDPRPGEPLEDERKWAQSQIESFDPPPSIIIDSGGGFQGFWLLDREYETNGSVEEAARLETYNQHIAIQLQADACHNIDRVMRLPGTINVPNAKKLKRGRKPALAKLVLFDGSRRYPLSAFTPAPSIQTKGLRNGVGAKISGNLPKVDLDRLPDKVSDRLRNVILKGEDGEDPTRFPSRSEALFHVCCELARAGLDDQTIAAIIMDRELGISASVLDKPRPTEYAARQIQRARDETESPELRELNDQYAVVQDYGGKCRVISEERDYAMVGRTRITAHSFEDFRNMYCNRLVKVGKRHQELGKWWLHQANRRQYRTITFAPGKEVPGNVYNLWKGFACKPIPGDCGLFLEHMLKNVCRGETELYDYLLNWMSRAVQRPGVPGEVAVVLRGKQGTGKSKFAKVFGSLWGPHYVSVSDPKHLTGSFNAHLKDCVALFADEAFYAGDKKHESILEQIVTEETIMIEGKGLDAVQSPNCIHLIMASNSDWVVPAGHEERRFFVLDVGEGKMQNSEFFEALDRQMDNGGREALLHLLQTRDLTGFNVRRYPQTQALREQKLLSLETYEEEWVEVLRDGVTPDADFWNPGPEFVSVHGFIKKLERRRALPPNRRALHTKVGLFLKRYAARDVNGHVIETKVRRDCLMMNGRYVEYVEHIDNDGKPVENPAVESVRRLMIKLRPLKELRRECEALVEHWASFPACWVYGYEEEPDPQGELKLGVQDEIPF